MPKFTLICEHTDVYGKPNEKITHEFTKEYLPDVIEDIEMFLKGAGFVISGVLDIVPLEEPWTDDVDFTGIELYDEQDLPTGKSHHYFDTERNK